jgi:hypothetical protein
MLTAGFGITGVIGAGVSIIAIDGGTVSAIAFTTGLPHGAGIVVAAGEALVVGND